MADSGNIIAKAYVAIIPTMEGSQATITKELTGASVEASEKAGKDSGSKFGEKFASALKGTAVAIGAALTAATAGAVATGKAFLNAANDVSSMGDAIGDNAAKMMLDTKSYQEWDFVLQRAGSSIDAMKTSMKTLANAAVNNADAFNTLGISQEQLASMNQAELFDATVKALQNVENEQERTALASKLLGKGALELGGIFNMTNEELDASKKKMYELGAYMDEDALAASDNYQDTMLDMQDSIKGLKIRLISDFLPGITSVMDGLSKVFSGNGGIAEIEKGLQMVIGKITSIAPQFFSLASSIVLSLLQGFAPMLPTLVSSIFSFITQAIVTITGLIPQLTPVITEGVRGICQALFVALPIIIQALIEMSKELVTWLSTGDNVKTFVDGLISLVSMLAESFADFLPILLPALVNIIGQIADSLTEPKNVNMILQSVLYIVGAIVVALVNALPEIGGVIVKLCVNITNQLKTWGGQLFQNIGTWLGSIITKALQFVQNINTNIRNWWSNLVSNAKSKASSFLTDIINTFKTLPGKVTQIGKDVINGLINGVKSLATKAVQTVKNIGSNLVSGMKSVLKIGSPSKVFAQLGEWTGEGYLNGVKDSFGDVEDFMTNNMGDLTGNMTASVNAYASQGQLQSGVTNTYNGGSININVYAAEGQNVNDLANVIAEKLEDMTRRKGAVYA